MSYVVCLSSRFLLSFGLSSLSGWAQSPKAVITTAIDESRLVTLLEGNTPHALEVKNDRGPVKDQLRLDHYVIGAQTGRRDGSAL